MYMDQNLLFDTGLALTATANSTNQLDLVNARDLGVGDDTILHAVCIVTSALLSAGATTLQVALQSSTDNVTYDTLAQSFAIPKASLVAGAKVSIPFPPLQPGQSKGRYVRMAYTVATGPFTGGAITSFLVLDDNLAVGQAAYGYPPGIVIAN